MSVLAAIAWMIIVAAFTWGYTLAHAIRQISRLRAEMSRAEAGLRREIRHWQHDAARARARAAQLAREAASWAEGHRQGRADVIGLVPVLIAAQQRPAEPPAAADVQAEAS